MPTLAELDALHTAAMTPVEAAAYLNDPANGTPVYGELTGNALRIWAAANPTDYAQLKAARDAGSVHAEMAVLLVQTPDSVLDMSNPAIQALVEGLLQGGVLTQAGRDALYAAATEPRSLAQEHGLTVTPNKIGQARGLLDDKEVEVV